MAIVQVTFVISLMPTIMHATHKPTFLTSSSTAIAVYIFVVTVATLELWFTATLMFLNGVQWTILAYQRRKLDIAAVRVDSN